MNETKKLTSTHWNAFPDCVGLELSAPQSGGPDQGFGLNADLNFGRQPLSGEGVSFRLGAKTGFLRVELDRCEITGTRFAMRDQPATVQREVKREETASKTTETKGSLAAKFGVGGSGVTGDAAAGASVGHRRATEEAASYREERIVEIHKVTARGTNSEPSWEIADPDIPTLDGRYLGKENLCEIVTADDAFRITAEFKCRKRDLSLTEIDRVGFSHLTTTKEKLALAVVASELGKALEELGELLLCRSQLAASAEPDGQDVDP